MIVGLFTINLHLPEADSLKSKRQVIKSLKDRISSRYNVSIAEVGGNELWQRCDIGIAIVTNESVMADKVFNEIRNLVLGTPSVEMIDSTIEML
ncbi:MAG: DUF503 domain-containing protein [Nitrospirae bacterium]|nr:DUF503 domain-containing protein [Nitrospirota bacterium]